MLKQYISKSYFLLFCNSEMFISYCFCICTNLDFLLFHKKVKCIMLLTILSTQVFLVIFMSPPSESGSILFYPARLSVRLTVRHEIVSALELETRSRYFDETYYL